MTADDERIRDYVAGLPDASGTFTGTLFPWAAEALAGEVPDLFPVEIDTYDKPNSAAGAVPPMVLAIRSGDQEWTLPVDHTEPLGGNRVRVWVRRPAVAS